MNQIPVLAGVCLFRKGKMLLLKCVSDNFDNNKWGPPGGHGNDGETVFETALRETKEETGLDVNISGLVQAAKLNVSDGRQFLLVFYFAETEDVSKIKIDPRESSDYAWASLEEVISGKYEIRSQSAIKPILIRAFKEKFLPLDGFKDINFVNPH